MNFFKNILMKMMKVNVILEIVISVSVLKIYVLIYME